MKSKKSLPQIPLKEKMQKGSRRIVIKTGSGAQSKSAGKEKCVYKKCANPIKVSIYR